MSRAAKITVLIVCLCLFGLVMIGSASVVDAARDFADKWYYLKFQLLWTVIGFTCFFISSRIPYHAYEKFVTPLLVTNLVLLILVLIPGIGTKILGARRWLNLGGFNLQPGELAKLTLALYLPSILKKKGGHPFVPFACTTGLLAALIMLEPDLGTTIVVGALAVVTYFGSGGPLKPLLLSVPIVLVAGLLLIFLSPYRRERLLTYLNHAHDPQGSSYHIHQVTLSLGSGGFFGVGLGQSKQKYEYLPEATTDSIFAIIAEELGFVGASVLILIFLSLIFQGLLVTANAPNAYAASLSLAITSWIGVQSLTNLSAMVALFPLTGIPLPFISYGGSALVILLFASGILVNIAHTK